MFALYLFLENHKQFWFALHSKACQKTWCTTNMNHRHVYLLPLMLPDVSVLRAKPPPLSNPTSNLFDSHFLFYIMFCGGVTTTVFGRLFPNKNSTILLKQKSFYEFSSKKNLNDKSVLLKYGSNIMINCNPQQTSLQ